VSAKWTSITPKREECASFAKSTRLIDPKHHQRNQEKEQRNGKILRRLGLVAAKMRHRPWPAMKGGEKDALHAPEYSSRATIRCGRDGGAIFPKPWPRRTSSLRLKNRIITAARRAFDAADRHYNGTDQGVTHDIPVGKITHGDAGQRP